VCGGHSINWLCVSRYMRLEFKYVTEIFRCGLDSSGSEWGPVAGSCEHGNEASGYIKGGEILD